MSKDVSLYRVSDDARSEIDRGRARIAELESMLSSEPLCDFMAQIRCPKCGASVYAHNSKFRPGMTKRWWRRGRQECFVVTCGSGNGCRAVFLMKTYCAT